MGRSVCCVDYMDYDVSKYLAETYLPTIKAKEWKTMVNDQYKYHLKNYTREYDDDILKNWTVRGYSIDGTPHLMKQNFNRYLLRIHKSGYKNVKRKKYYNQTPAHYRAMKYRKEARFIRANCVPRHWRSE